MEGGIMKAYVMTIGLASPGVVPFEVKSKRNITHIFLLADFDCNVNQIYQSDSRDQDGYTVKFV